MRIIRVYITVYNDTQQHYINTALTLLVGQQ